MEREPPDWERLLRRAWFGLGFVVVVLVVLVLIGAKSDVIAYWAGSGIVCAAAIIMGQHLRDNPAARADPGDAANRLSKLPKWLYVAAAALIFFPLLFLLQSATSEGTARLIIGGLLLVGTVFVVTRRRRDESD